MLPKAPRYVDFCRAVRTQMRLLCGFQMNAATVFAFRVVLTDSFSLRKLRKRLLQFGDCFVYTLPVEEVSTTLYVSRVLVGFAPLCCSLSCGRRRSGCLKTFLR